MNYTIADENVYAGNVDIICTTEGVFDSEGVQMDLPYTEEDVFTIDTKPPQIYDFPSDTLTPGEDYTIRVVVSDDSTIQSVMLHYHFGSNWNTKPMSYDPGSEEYIAVVTPPADATLLTYKISAYDVHDNGDESSEEELCISAEDDENKDDEEEPEDEEQDSDGDGYNDDMEESYGTDCSNSSDTPEDADNDGTPNDDSPDGNYTGDTDDDNDGLSDAEEESLGSDPKNDDVSSMEDKNGYLVDTDGDEEFDTYYDPDTTVETTVEYLSDDTYLVDDDGDGEWNYEYNAGTGAASAYLPPSKPSSENELPMILIAVGFIFVVMGVFVALYKFGYIKGK